MGRLFIRRYWTTHNLGQNQVLALTHIYEFDATVRRLLGFRCIVSDQPCFTKAERAQAMSFDATFMSAVRTVTARFIDKFRL